MSDLESPNAVRQETVETVEVTELSALSPTKLQTGDSNDPPPVAVQEFAATPNNKSGGDSKGSPHRDSTADVEEQDDESSTAVVHIDDSVASIPVQDLPPNLNRETTASPREFAPVEYAMNIKGLAMKRLDAAVLSDISFSVPKGSCFAILGESGAGKSTLLKLLARKLELSLLTIEGTGVVPANIWYIPQDLDVLYEFDTALGTVVFLHQLLYKSSTQEATEVANEWLDIVGFPKDFRNTLIGKIGDGLTGGQRRLLSVAQALCARAEIVLLDEPTTGLDSASCANIIRVLRDMCAKNGITCVCTIHQPNDEVLDLFDRVLVMSSGKAYSGDRDASFAAQRSHKKSEAEVLLTMVTTRSLALSSAAPDAPASEQLEPQLPFSQSTSFGFVHETTLLLKRAAQRKWANVFAFRFRFIVTFALAMVVGVAFLQLDYDDPTTLRDQMGVYIALCGTSFVSIIIAASLFPGQKPAFLNEMAQCQHYSVAAFMAATTLFEIAMAFATTWWAPVLAAMIGIPFSMHNLWFTNLLQVAVSDSFGFLLSTRVGPEVAIGALIPCVGLISCLLGTGVASPPREGTGYIFHVVKWLSFFKYGFAAFLIDQFPRMTGSCNTALTEGCAYTNAQEVLELFVYEGDDHSTFVNSLGFQWMMMVIVMAFMRIVSLIMLYRLVAMDKIRYENVTNWAAMQRKPKKNEIEGIGEEVIESGESSRSQSVTAMDLAQFGSGNGIEDAPNTSVAMMSITEEEMMSDVCSRNASFTRGSMAALEFGGLTVSVKEPDPNGGEPRVRYLLDKVHGSARAGQVTAIIGPSLAGKSVLLRVLSQQSPITGIEECVGNLELTVDAEKRKTYTTRLVYQQDAFTPGDTVSTAVYRQIMLCRPNDAKAVQEVDMNWALKCVGLEHVKDKAIVATSGGEQRRLSVACQLVHRPQVLLLDEPTSGLDSERAFEVMYAIHEFSRRFNAVVLCTLQQPGKSLLPLLDEIILMRNAAVVFRGSIEMASQHFNITEKDCEKKAATDVMLERIGEDQYRSDVFSPFGDSNRVRNEPAKPQRSATAGFGLALSLLVKRNFISRVLVSPGMYVGELLIKFVVFPIILGLFFLRVDDDLMISRTGLFFITLAGFGFVGLIFPVVVMSLERNVYSRDANARDYSPTAYQLARWVFELPGEFLGTMIGSAIMYGLVGFEQPIYKFMFAIFASFQASLGFGYMLAAFPLPLSVLAGLSAFTIIAMMMGCDVVVTPDQIHRVGVVYALEFYAPIRHGFTALIHAEAAALTEQTLAVTLPSAALFPNGTNTTVLPPTITVNVPFTGTTVIQRFGLTRWHDSEEMGWIWIAVTFAVYRILAIVMFEGIQMLQRSRFPRMTKADGTFHDDTTTLPAAAEKEN